MKTALPILLASTAFVATPAFAEDAPVAQAVPPAVVTLSKADFDKLMSRMDSLESELKSVKAAQAVTTTAVPPGPSAGTAPIAPASDLPGWLKGTSISGKGYANVSSINHESDGADLADNGVQTELKRFYFQVDHKFNDMFSARFRTDMRYNANGTSKDVLVYVKHAYLQAKFAPEFYARVGVADLPWVPFVEDLYGYRFVENVLVDRTKFGTSADWGVHVGGSFGKGLVNYAASAVNGAGYKTLSRSSNTIDLAGRVDVHPMKGVTLAGGVYTGKLGKSSDVNTTFHRTTRWNAAAAYTAGPVRLGGEYFHASNWTTITSALNDSAEGWSAFGSFAFTPQLAVFGRYDWVKPSTELNPALRDRYFNIGLNYKPIKQIDLALVYKRDRAKNGFLSTSNGTIGGIDQGSYDEFGLFSQFAF